MENNDKNPLGIFGWYFVALIILTFIILIAGLITYAVGKSRIKDYWYLVSSVRTGQTQKVETHTYYGVEGTFTMGDQDYTYHIIK